MFYAGIRFRAARNWKRSNYKYAKKGGYPLGSGGIESSNKTISHVRLKRPGAWWYVEKANHMLALRCSKYNGTFQKLFQRYAREPRKRRMYKRSKNG